MISVERVDTQNGWIYYLASPENATQRYLYRKRLDGSGKAERVTPATVPGVHSYNISPRGDFAIHLYSSFNRVPVTEIVRLPQHAVQRTLIDNKQVQDRLAQLKQTPSEFFKVDIGEGVQLDGWMMKPHDFDPQKHYPVLFYVYGEPWGQTVMDSWGGRNRMWHQMLAQQGYIVMSVDNRGTPAPRGRGWRKIIYRKMGIVNSGDQAGAARAIAKWPFVDPTRDRNLGLERWRFVDTECDVSISGCLFDGCVGRARAGSSLLRHDLPGAVLRTSQGPSRRMEAELADHLCGTVKGQSLRHSRDR